MIDSQQASKCPTLAQAIEIITMQLTRAEQGRQLAFMAENQGREFAEMVRAKVKAAGGVRAK